MKITGTPQVLCAYDVKQKNIARLGGSRVWQEDQIELSDNAQMFLDVLRAAKTDVLKPSDPQKLAELKQQVSEGTYHVDAQSLAKKIMMEL